MIIKALVVTLTIATSAAAGAQTSGEKALSARASWSAFECAYLADMLGKDAEQRRLESYGYSQGLQFIAAHKSGQIEESDIHSTVPSDFLDGSVTGPTPDFMLGRLYESIRNFVGDQVLEDDDFHISESEQLNISVRYGKSNCALLGGAR